MNHGSKKVANVAVRLALSESREEEALTQIMPKAVGLNVGGKVGVARFQEHLSVAVFVGIGLLHLDEVAIGLGHRALPKEG